MPSCGVGSGKGDVTGCGAGGPEKGRNWDKYSATMGEAGASGTWKSNIVRAHEDSARFQVQFALTLFRKLKR